MPPAAAPDGRQLRIAVLCDSFPELSQTFVLNEVRALRRGGTHVRVLARARAARPNPDAAEEAAHFAFEDETRGSRLRALAWLALRRPGRCGRDLLERRRWRRAEAVPPLRVLAPVARRLAAFDVDHLHAHFAWGAALDALRLARLLGRPYSVTAHARDIYVEPANLEEKLARAAFATSGCDYTVRDLRAVAGPAHAERVHRIVMGVDVAALRRQAPPPDDRRVLGVGRLVEKKGWVHLVDAIALLRADGRPARLVLAGEGPQRPELEARIARHGLADLVELPGAVAPRRVRTLLEGADVLAMPSVVTASGDRDSMPVVVKEALAMEVPVVASDAAGLPEVVRPPWGLLVPPGDARALAAALGDVLARPAAERAAMGRAGRAHVAECCSLDGEAAKLLGLVRAAVEAKR